jgi:phospho-N-acetylmuramoyl-pentapeptide-transferase
MEYLGIRFDLFLFFVTFFLTFALYPLWINFVYNLSMGEVSRVHAQKSGTPTMGGFIFMLTVAIVTVLFNRSRSQTFLPVFIAALAGLLGILEDFVKVYTRSTSQNAITELFSRYANWHERTFHAGRYALKKLFFFIVIPWEKFKELARTVGSEKDSGLETYQKFIFQGILGGFMAYWTYFKLGWDYLWFPFMGNVHIGFLYPIVVLLLFIIVLNAVAFTDGLDGLAGGLAFFCFVAFWAISRMLNYNSLAGFSATFAGALLPFLYFNVYPARIMMGNVGSHVLGASLAVLAVLTHREVAFLVIGTVFLIDGITSPLQQLSVKLTGKRLFRMAPIHHHFEKLGWPEVKVTFRFWIFGILFALLGFFIAIL